MGEQVSGKAGYGWFDGVRADLAAEGYASRARDIPALAVDGPHQRNRLYWIAVDDAKRERPREQGFQLRTGRNASDAANADVADADIGGCTRRQKGPQRDAKQRAADERPSDKHMANGHESFVQEQSSAGQLAVIQPDARSDGEFDSDDRSVTLGDALSAGLERHAGHGDERGRSIEVRSVAATDGCNGCLAERDSFNRWPGTGWGDRQETGHASLSGRNGSFWSDAEWIVCHDGKARRTKPDLRLLVDGLAGRIHLWRLAGNSIVAEEGAEVIRAFLDAEAEASPP
jgi:DNA (cytosine-5)-methyltransferase 1